MNCSCDKCGKSMDEGQFYTYKDGRKTELCKKCLTMHIDNFNPDTFLWILEKMDVPYIPEEWNSLRDKAFAKDPYKMNGMSVFGKYLSKMKLKQWKEYSWADTERLMAIGEEHRKMMEEERVEKEALAKEQLEAGVITEAQYKTMVSTKTQNAELSPVPINFPPGANNPFNESNFMDESELIDPAAELTQEDKLYLAMKWGRLYKPSEWVILETHYNKMMNSFDIQDADTEATLIMLSKINLKMNQAIDCGDLDGALKASKMYDSLRKSAKFTAAQNKSEKGNYVDSIGEFVIMCEREEGFIPRFATDIPQDKVDLTLRDMNNYLYKLVTQDLGFGQQIEDSIKKIQIQKEMEEAEKAAEVQDKDLYDLDPEEIVDQDFEEFYDSEEEQRLKDMKTIYGDDNEEDE